MNTKYTVAYGDTRTESTITFVSKHFHLYEVLSECGYNITEWELFKGICYIEYNGDYLPTGRYFKLIKAVRTDEEESDEVIFF